LFYSHPDIAADFIRYYPGKFFTLDTGMQKQVHAKLLADDKYLFDEINYAAGEILKKWSANREIHDAVYDAIKNVLLEIDMSDDFLLTQQAVMEVMDQYLLKGPNENKRKFYLALKEAISQCSSNAEMEQCLRDAILDDHLEALGINRESVFVSKTWGQEKSRA